eukprot:Ihof_evm6s306 gene=Ihof_evmTU6s306
MSETVGYACKPINQMQTTTIHLLGSRTKRTFAVMLEVMLYINRLVHKGVMATK